MECLTAFDIFYLGGLINRGIEIGPPYQAQASYIKIGEAVCERLSEGYTLPQILATASASDRRGLEVMAAAAQDTYCQLPTFSAGSSSVVAQPICPGGGCRDTAVPCSPRPAAVAAFDRRLQAIVPVRQRSTSSSETEGALTDLVIEVVDHCGYQTMVDIADHYPDTSARWLRSTAVSALGEISALPSGLRCADLKRLGLGPKQAVDYWFLWSSPALMDADLNGIPCQTVWPDVERYMPAGQ